MRSETGNLKTFLLCLLICLRCFWHIFIVTYIAGLVALDVVARYCNICKQFSVKPFTSLAWYTILAALKGEEALSVPHQCPNKMPTVKKTAMRTAECSVSHFAPLCAFRSLKLLTHTLCKILVGTAALLVPTKVIECFEIKMFCGSRRACNCSLICADAIC